MDQTLIPTPEPVTLAASPEPIPTADSPTVRCDPELMAMLQALSDNIQQLADAAGISLNAPCIETEQ